MNNSSQIFILVDWPDCAGLFQSREFSAASHLVRPAEEVAIGSSYMVPMEFASVNGLTGEPYKLATSPAAATAEVRDYDGNRYILMN